MRSSLILGIATLTIAATSIVQAHPFKTRSEHTCGSLGPGINACKCGEVVVKAAKVQKPLVYVPPQAINEAAIAREAIGRFSAGTGSGSIASNVISNPYSSGMVSTSSSSSSSSNSHSSSSSSLSSVSVLGGSSPFNTFLNDASSNSGCGCGKKSEPMIPDLLFDTNKQIVPSFPPIGDLCYPSKVQNGKIQAITTTKTKVTPAYPSKITCSSPTPEQGEVCVQTLNGQVDEAGMRKLGLTSAYSVASDGLFRRLSSGNAFGSASNLGKYISNNAGSTHGSLGGYSSSGSVGYSGASSVGGYSSTGYNKYGSGYADTSVGSLGQFNSKISSYGNKFGSDVEVAGSYRSNCNDFGDEAELPKDYSYPRLPADPVSLTLAYRNIFSPINVAYNKKVRFVPEDKLSFGHRTIPNETPSSKKKLDVPEEKLQILDKPVVELKPIPAVPITGSITYNEQEEAKLAELEAIERERIHQEEVAEQQQEHFITYGDLGYTPINGALPGKLSSSVSMGAIDTFNAEDDDRGCGPVGPPAFDYVPGTVVINQEIVNEDEIEDGIQTDEDYEHSDDDEEDYDEYSSGIFAKLRSSAQKYGLPCGVV